VETGAGRRPILDSNVIAQSMGVYKAKVHRYVPWVIGCRLRAAFIFCSISGEAWLAGQSNRIHDALLSQQSLKIRLFEVPVMDKRGVNSVLPHNEEARTIGNTPTFVRPVLIELERIRKGFAGLRYDDTYGLQLALVPRPKYDLLFFIDLNGTPYSDPASPGIVIRVANHKANVTLTGHPMDMATDTPNLFVCEAETGELREIKIILPDKLAKQAGKPPVSITTPELESLMMDDSSISTDGYSLSDVNFNKVYDVTSEIVNPSPRFGTFDFARLFPLNGLRNDTYKACLKQVAGSSDPDVHFIKQVLKNSPVTSN
jgi:hypothetical protein